MINCLVGICTFGFPFNVLGIQSGKIVRKIVRTEKFVGTPPFGPDLAASWAVRPGHIIFSRESRLAACCQWQL
jgi:hypothetical protein